MTASEARDIWIKIVKESIKSYVFPKLTKLKFTYGGRIRTERRINGRGVVVDRNYEWIKKHFPSLLKKFEKEVRNYKENTI